MTGASGAAPLAHITEEDIEFQKEIDTRDLNCPLPALHTRKVLADIQSGNILKILATDPGATRDFQAFAKRTGNELLEHNKHDRMFTFYMRRR